MRTRRWFPVVLAGMGVLAVASTAAAQARQRSMYVSVLDKNGAPLPEVTPSDIVIREDNITREILRIVPAAEPIHLALLIDNSAAAESFISDYRRALVPFINAILEASSAERARNQISIIGLAERPTIITEFTSDAGLLTKGVSRIFAQSDSQTYLLDAVDAVTRGFMRGRVLRPVVVGIVTAGPDLSDRTYTTVLDSLRTTGSAFHAITLGLPVNLSLDRGIVLERGSRETGGNYDNLLSGSALTDRLKRLAVEITHQHRVIYARPPSLIPPERITVTGSRPEIVVRGTVPTPLEQDRQ